jgi:MipA family protein
MRPIRPAAALVMAAGLLTLPAHADQPLWELGMGLGALRVPHYRGSDQSHDWLLPVPYLVYRGKILRADREGTRAVLLDSDRLDFDVSLDASPPTRTGDNRARAGMEDLSATLEVGPNINLMLARGAGWKLDLRVPLRAAFTVGSRPRSLGWTSTPVLNLDLQVQGWNIGLQGGPLAATRRYHAYFYDVAPAFATASRPSYAAAGGMAGWGLTAAVSRRIGPWWVASFARGDMLDGAVFRDSPLVKKQNNLTFGFAASYVFKVSEARVADQR